MTGLLVLLLLLDPGSLGSVADTAEDTLGRRVAGLLTGDPVFSGIAAVVPLYARAPGPLGPTGAIAWAKGDLRAGFLVEDGRSFLRVSNPRTDPALLAAGTVFACDGVEVAVARDTILPGDFTAVVPAAPLAAAARDGAADLRLVGAVPPPLAGALLVGLPAFEAAVAEAGALRGEEPYASVIAGAAVRARRDGLAAALAPLLRGSGGTVVGVAFLVGDRPVGIHVFASEDLLVAALPDLLLGFAVEIRDDEVRNSGIPRRRPSAADSKSRALSWLRGIARAPATWTESHGTGFEAVVTDTALGAIGHVVLDPRGALLHAGFFRLPEADAPSTGDEPDREPPGLRDRRARTLPEDGRREGGAPAALAVAGPSPAPDDELLPPRAR